MGEGSLQTFGEDKRKMVRLSGFVLVKKNPITHSLRLTIHGHRRKETDSGIMNLKVKDGC